MEIKLTKAAVPGTLAYYYLRIEGKEKPVASLKCVERVYSEKGKIVTLSGEAKQKLEVAVEIHGMHTDSQHRRKGYCSTLIRALQTMPSVVTIGTSWTDSKSAGRAVLQKLGFERDGEWLIWKR